MTYIIIAATVLLTYILIVCITNKQIPNSLSESVFLMMTQGQWLWTICIGIVALLTIPAFVSKASESTQWIAFMACAALAFVAVCPLMGSKESIEKSNGSYTVHMVAAFACGALSQLVVIINCWPFLFAWVPWLVAFILITKDRKWQHQVFFAEMTCFISTFIFCIV